MRGTLPAQKFLYSDIRLGAFQQALSLASEQACGIGDMVNVVRFELSLLAWDMAGKKSVSRSALDELHGVVDSPSQHRRIEHDTTS